MGSRDRNGCFDAAHGAGADDRGDGDNDNDGADAADDGHDHHGNDDAGDDADGDGGADARVSKPRSLPLTMGDQYP